MMPIGRSAAVCALLLLAAACGTACQGSGKDGVGSRQRGISMDRRSSVGGDTWNAPGGSGGLSVRSGQHTGSLSDNYLGAYPPGSTNRLGATNKDAADVGTGMNVISYHRNTRMEMSPYLAQKIAAMDEVRTACAVVTDSNVYMAVQLEGHVPHADGSGIRDPANRGTGTSALDARSDTLSGITGNSYDHYNGAASSAPLNDGVPDGLQQRIVAAVHALSSPALQHVFVSADPGFLRRLEGYSRQQSQTGILTDRVDEFNQLAARLFPYAEGTGSYGGSAGSGDLSRRIGNTNGDMRSGSTVPRER